MAFYVDPRSNDYKTPLLGNETEKSKKTAVLKNSENIDSFTRYGCLISSPQIFSGTRPSYVGLGNPNSSRMIPSDHEDGLMTSHWEPPSYDLGQTLRNSEPHALYIQEESERFYIREPYHHWEEKFEKGGHLDLSEGPVENRRVTDCIFIILYSISLISVFCFSTWSFIYGDPSKLIHGLDYEGNSCGISSEVKDFPLLYWPSKQFVRNATLIPLPVEASLPICTKTCPVEYSQNRLSQCAEKYISNGFCTWYGKEPAVLRYGRYCVFNDEIDRVNSRLLDMGGTWISNIYIAWPYILYLFFF
ncbi:hypothetical protein IE077_000204 [Cardiosporidium cionae]|uniref:Uncharacterized protein n=1 Tax=Cardiosporidium cionae TaxID=476202 RepID=A0ABQ7JCK3_9APIC|nr:hypothetical protein IE077_000204 [Cardiosporidium cionae]|eukprot:KAF8821728.1 hypothetical protein IE077_000204 [Cardiosporidium cionae]